MKCHDFSWHFFLPLCEALCDLCVTLCNPQAKSEGYTELHKDHTELHGELLTVKLTS